MSFLSLLGSTQPENATNTRLEMLAGARRLEDAEAAERVTTKKLANATHSGFAYEVPTKEQSWNREILKATFHESAGGPTVVCVGRLKRTAALAPIMQWMGLGNEATDPNMPPPSDAQLIMAYYSKMMAKQRWSKANNALGALRAMKMVGGGGLGGLLGGGGSKGPLGALGKGTVKMPEQAQSDSPNDTPEASPVHPKLVRNTRMSVSFVQNDPKAKNLATSNMARLPKATDIKNILRTLQGSWVFCLLDPKQEYAFVAVSEDAETPLYSAVTDDGCILFSTAVMALPKDCEVLQMPKGSYFIGRYNGNRLKDLVFKTFVKSPPADQSAAA